MSHWGTENCFLLQILVFLVFIGGVTVASENASATVGVWKGSRSRMGGLPPGKAVPSCVGLSYYNSPPISPSLK